VTESITPRPNQNPEIRFQPSMLSVPSASATVVPDEQAPLAAQQAPKRGARRKLWFFTALATVAGVLGASLLRTPAHVSSRVHSGSPGYKQSPSGHDLHWEKKALTLYLDDSLQKLGPNAHEAVMQAFGQWVASDPRLPDLSFDTGKTSATPQQDGKSTVSYGRISAPGHEHDVAITVTYANDKTGEIIEADIILNSLYPMAILTPKPAGQASANGSSSHGKDDDKDRDRNATNSKSMNGGEESLDCKNRYDAQNVTTHEAGHFFGLGEDPVERKATMFQTIDQCETHKRALATTDVGALTVLYTESADPEEAKAGARACSFGGVPAGSRGLWVSAAIFGLGLVRRRSAR
jgi:Matrixin